MIPTELTQYTIKKELKAVPASASDSEKASLNDKNEEIVAYNKALAVQLKIVQAGRAQDSLRGTTISVPSCESAHGDAGQVPDGES